MKPNRLLTTWIDHPSIDYLLAALAAFLWQLGEDPLTHLPPTQRFSLALALAGIAAALLGFGIAATSILFAMPTGPRLRGVLEKVGGRLGNLFVASLRSLAVATVVFVAAVPLDRADEAGAVWIAVAGVAVLAILRTGRMLWLVAMTVGALSLDARSSASGENPRRWTPPALEESHYEVPKREIG